MGRSVLLGRAVAAALLASWIAACSTTGTQRPESVSAAPRGHLVWGRWGEGDTLELFTSNADGSDVHAFLADESVEQPKFSSDGTQIAVAIDGDRVLTGVANADGSGFRTLDAPSGTLNLACVLWSPDGERLACETWDETDPSAGGISTVRASDGGDLQRVTTHGTPCAWSPDGTQLAFWLPETDDAERSGLYVVGADGSGEHRVSGLTFGPACDWSPDGRTLLTERNGSLVLVGLDGDVERIRIEGSSRDMLASRPAYSPDGSHVVFSYDDGNGQFDIYTVAIDGTDLHRITSTIQGEEFGDWGP